MLPGDVVVGDSMPVPEPCEPVREGLVFTGWYTDSSCTQRYDMSSRVTGDMTLYAGWAEEPEPVGPEPDQPTVLGFGMTEIGVLTAAVVIAALVAVAVMMRRRA